MQAPFLPSLIKFRSVMSEYIVSWLNCGLTDIERTLLKAHPGTFCHMWAIIKIMTGTYLYRSFNFLVFLSSEITNITFMWNYFVTDIRNRNKRILKRHLSKTKLTICKQIKYETVSTWIDNIFSHRWQRFTKTYIHNLLLQKKPYFFSTALFEQNCTTLLLQHNLTSSA